MKRVSKKVGRGEIGHGPWPGFCCRVRRMCSCLKYTLVSLMLVFCDICKHLPVLSDAFSLHCLSFLTPDGG